MKKSLYVLAQVITLTIGTTQLAWSHDEGHGPKVTDFGKQGGIVSPVVAAKDASQGAKAKLVHKSELVRSEDGTVRVYFYDESMNPLNLDKFSAEAKGILESKKGKKWSKTNFSLKKEEGAYVGKAPKAEKKPYNIDVYVTENSKELLTAFDNLD